MDKILIDTNVILDIILERQPFFEYSSRLFQTTLQKGIALYVTATTVTDLYYIIRKAKGHALAISFITDLMGFMEVAGVDKEVILVALGSRIADFEDAIQAHAAEKSDVRILVTRDVDDFAPSGLVVFSPEAILKEL